MNQFPGYVEYKEQKYELAFTKLLSVADSGNAEAQCMIGTLYQNGLGIERDSNKAAYWYEQSSEQGYAVATNNLAGLRFMEGRNEESEKLYSLSRSQGFVNAPLR